MVGSVCLVALLFLATFAQIEVTPLNFNQLVHDSVQADSWRFYSFTTAANTGFLLNIQHGSKYDLDVFVRKGYEVPSRQTFDYSETGTLSNITINGRVESQSTHYIVGVFGFRGTAVPFSIMVTASNGCPMDCSGHGSCVRQACSCIDGYAGEGCQYQVGSVDLGKKNGPFTLNKGEWKYWSLYLFSTQSLHILTNRLSRDGDVDFYVRRAQIPTLFDYDYADLTRFTPEHNSFTLNISNPLLGNWFIGAFSFETTTFDWTVYSSVSCPNNCSLHGSCVGVSCSCDGDFYGVSCEELRYPVQLGQVYRGFVGENTWNYYTAIANSLNSMLITVQHPSDGSDCDLYIRTGDNPSLTTFSARNITMDPTMTLLVPSPGEQQIKIGVYGYSRCSYTLKVSIVAANDCDCSNHGRCANGLCICDQGWAGSKCEVGTISLSNGITARGAVAPGQWQFFSFPVHATHQFVVIQKETETVGDNWLLIAMGTYPTLERYNAIDRQRSDYHRISFRFRSLFNATFYFGIYGNPNSPKKSFPFQIAAYQVPF